MIVSLQFTANNNIAIYRWYEQCNIHVVVTLKYTDKGNILI